MSRTVLRALSTPMTHRLDASNYNVIYNPNVVRLTSINMTPRELNVDTII